MFTPVNISNVVVYGSESIEGMSISGTDAGLPTTVYADGGNDEVSVGVLSVSLGSPLTLVGGSGNDTLSINDPLAAASGVNPKSYTITPTQIQAGTSSVDYSDFTNVTLETAVNGSYVTVQGTPSGTNVTVLGPAASVIGADFDGINGPLDIAANANLTTLRLSNSNQTPAHTFDITSTTVTRDGAALSHTAR